MLNGLNEKKSKAKSKAKAKKEGSRDAPQA